jgi:hypothetical protein
MSKRVFELCGSSSSSSPPPKRLHLASSPSLFLSSNPEPPSTPYTPRYPVISDSPTNPFGRKRALSLALPHPTSFGKHLALRFQLINGGGRCRDKDGAYRVVQVPLSYNFRLLHKLLLFLFNGPAPTHASDRMTRKGKRNGKAQTNHHEIPSGHLFEAVKDIALHRTTYKAGQIKNSQTWAKLSSVRDPYRYQNDMVQGANNAIATYSVAKPDAGDEEQGWRWVAEEDLTLGQVWRKGPDLSRGVIYVRLVPSIFSLLTP